MYDLEIIVPAELNSPEIVQRFKDFRKWGFVNNANEIKIKLYFLASYDNNPNSLKNLCEGWPENFTTEGIITPYKHVSQRIMYYYSEIMKPDTAKWYVRIDEDSQTDLAGLVEKINKWFDHERDYHVVGEISKEIDDIEHRIITEIGYDWYDEVCGYDFSTAPVHEIEMSLTSNAAVKRILANKPSRDLLRMRREFDDGHGDMTFAFAARLVKIYPTSVQFITREPRANEFSLYGGKHNHIHDIAKDRHPKYLQWLESTNHNQLWPELTKGSYLLEYKNQHEKKWIRINDKKRITEINPRNDPEWSHTEKTYGLCGVTDDNKLHLFIQNDKSFFLTKTKFGFECNDLKITKFAATQIKI